MTMHPTVLPRRVVLYLFVSPNQRLLRSHYTSIFAAKKDWHPTRLMNAATRDLAPWTSDKFFALHQGVYRPTFTVAPMKNPVLRYEGGATVPPSDIAAPKPYKQRQRRASKTYRPSARTLARRLRDQQILDDTEPRIRTALRVHPTYYEDSWGVRDSDRNWKTHRRTQWKT